MDSGDPPVRKAPPLGRPLCTFDTKGKSVSLTVLKAISEVPQERWDACALASARAMGSSSCNPFVMWGFLRALESSRSVDPAEGWMPQHLVAHDVATGQLLGAMPLYLKSHSYGEFVFDHAWARAYRTAVASSSSGTRRREHEPSSVQDASATTADTPRARAVPLKPGVESGSSRAGYYPKLQSCIPFTPVTGPRILVSEEDAQRREALYGILARGLVALADRLGVSSVHVTFATAPECRALGRAGFLPRLGLQFHWCNTEGWRSFDEFTASLKQSRRKAIRQERRKVAEAGVVIQRLRGRQIRPHHWDAFYQFYRATVESKWGRDYLKSSFFAQMGGAMGERVVLILAEDRSSGTLVAGALNLLGDDCVYGRHWGCSRRYDALHFELCYYQAIEVAIELGLPRVEAGAQGDHKLARGYLPTLTRSCHYLRHAGFRKEVARFLKLEREQTYIRMATVSTQRNPFKSDAAEHLRRQGLRIEGKRLLVE